MNEGFAVYVDKLGANATEPEWGMVKLTLSGSKPGTG